jgi:hypothetical protein
MYRRSRSLFLALTVFSSATGLRTSQQSNEGRAAICFSGEFRSFRKVLPAANRSVISAFDHPPDVFLFLNLQDSGKGGNGRHEGEDIDTVVETLKPVAARYYNHDESLDWGSPIQQGSDCYRKDGTPSCCHYSWHGSIFWGVQKCWEMVKEYESENRFRYDFFVRARPDIDFKRELWSSIQKVTSSYSGSGKHAWLRKGTGSDVFALLSRDAADSYADTFKNTFLDSSCLHLPSEDTCKLTHTKGWSTECLLYRNLLSDGVEVHWDAMLPKCEPVRL